MKDFALMMSEAIALEAVDASEWNPPGSHQHLKTHDEVPNPIRSSGLPGCAWTPLPAGLYVLVPVEAESLDHLTASDLSQMSPILCGRSL